MKTKLRMFLAFVLVVFTLALLPASAKSTRSVTVEAATEGWQKNSKGWWYQKADGTYPKNQWYKISGKWYHFDASGYMQTGWLKLSGKWFYLGDSGAMRTGWQKISGKWYLFNTSNKGYTEGEMLHDVWIDDNGAAYWLTSSGAMATGWAKALTESNTLAWFYFSSDGKMVTGWLQYNGSWYYLDEAMVAGSIYEIGGKKYCFNSSGKMVTGWQKCLTNDGTYEWFYFDSNGAMHLGWLKDGGHWYYLAESIMRSTQPGTIAYTMIGGTKYYFNYNGYLVDSSGKETSPN